MQLKEVNLTQGFPQGLTLSEALRKALSTKKKRLSFESLFLKLIPKYH